ncbi:MAG: Holliday junction branch migration protein RuvA [Chloroflexi bacterium]|nr:Holliday junction branch migration protein RuvA [Chloroflexota bacterium]
MIAGLQGTIESRGADWVVIKVGGISFKVFVPTSALSSLGPIGGEARLHTHLHVREDVLSLYGFVAPDYLSCFEMLLGVGGVGPKVALTILSSFAPDRLLYALASQNADLLTQIPGVGKKMAARLILELRGKVEPGQGAVSQPQVSPDQAQVLAALGALGYTTAEAAAAVASLPDSPDVTPEDKIRQALAYFANQ